MIRGAYVLSMDDEIGDLADADVHVLDGRIVAVGRGLRASGTSINGRGTIVLPGRVLKRPGRLTAVDPRRVVRDAETRLAAVLDRAEADPVARAAVVSAATACCG